MLFFFVSCGGGGSNDVPEQVSSVSNDVTAIEMSQTNAILHLNEELELSLKFFPTGSVPHNFIYWKISDEDVVESKTVGANSGYSISMTIIGKTAGTATITASVGELSATCQVTVSDSPVDVEKITLDKSEIELYDRQTTSLLATIFPVYATDQTLKWTTENEDIATVSEEEKNSTKTAIVCGGRVGTTNVIATSNDGKVMAKCRVTVKSSHNINYDPYGNDNQW